MENNNSAILLPVTQMGGAILIQNIKCFPSSDQYPNSSIFVGAQKNKSIMVLTFETRFLITSSPRAFLQPLLHSQKVSQNP